MDLSRYRERVQSLEAQIILLNDRCFDCINDLLDAHNLMNDQIFPYEEIVDMVQEIIKKVKMHLDNRHWDEPLRSGCHSCGEILNRSPSNDPQQCIFCRATLDRGIFLHRAKVRVAHEISGLCSNHESFLKCRYERCSAYRLAASWTSDDLLKALENDGKP